MQNLSHLKALQALNATIRLGTLTLAADELGVTPAALGQRVRTLEVYLGIPLLERGPRGSTPTPAALAAAEDLAQGFAKLEEAAQKLQFERLNEIYIRAEPDWAELWLLPKLAAFQELYPSISVVIENMDDTQNRKPDFEVKFVASGSHDNSETLYSEYFLPVASPQIRDWVCSLPRETRLEGFSLLHLIDQTNPPYLYGWPEWVERFGYRKAVTGRGIQYLRVTQALSAAAHSNVGLLICGMSLALEMLDAGSLTTPFAPTEGAWSGYSYKLEYSESTCQRPQAAKFYDWLVEEARTTRTRIEAGVRG